MFEKLHYAQDSHRPYGAVWFNRVLSQGSVAAATAPWAIFVSSLQDEGLSPH